MSINSYILDYVKERSKTEYEDRKYHRNTAFQYVNYLIMELGIFVWLVDDKGVIKIIKKCLFSFKCNYFWLMICLIVLFYIYIICILFILYMAFRFSQHQKRPYIPLEIFWNEAGEITDKDTEIQHIIKTYNTQAYHMNDINIENAQALYYIRNAELIILVVLMLLFIVLELI